MDTPSSSPSPSKNSHSGDRPAPRVLGGPLALAFLSLPLLGAISILGLAFFLDPPLEPYEQVSERVQRLEWRDRYALAQMFLAHADGLGVGPVEAHSCVKEIADGNDLSLCRPSSADRISASVLLLDHMIAALARHEEGERGPRNPAGGAPRFSAPEAEMPYGRQGEDLKYGVEEGEEYGAEAEGCPVWDGPDGEGIGDGPSDRKPGALEI